ncbi:MAG: hypothetical protein KAJ17_13295 [Candidatus Krumholzibacteria bacterium]|nr:hypothetical protein [Candidatus Krumholzibacteria bacterium]
MKRSLWTLTTLVVVALVALPVLAANPNATKSVAGSEDGTSVLVIRVTASSQSIYGVTIKDASGSITDIGAPKGWVGISWGTDVIFRTDEKPIRAGSSLTFKVHTTNEDGELSISFRDKDSPIGSGKTF